jgi:deoxyribodipyrimidine photo-lyase
MLVGCKSRIEHQESSIVPSPTIVWFRRDLRLADNPALAEACRRGGPIVPVFIWAPEEEEPWQPGAASRWWLHHSLAALDRSLRKLGSRLVIRRGPTLAAFQRLEKETGATSILWNRLYEPTAITRDAAVKAAFTTASFNASLLYEPWDVLTGEDKPYKVFTPYYKACLASGEPPAPEPAPRRIEPFDGNLESLTVDDLDLLPKRDWASGFAETWQPGEAGALRALDGFNERAIRTYAKDRDRPDLAGTSRLSPHLHFGEVGPRQVWHAAPGAEPYRRQLIWREFAHQLLFHFPHTTREPLRPEFARFPWSKDAKALLAWQQGRTGYPIVDAGMRELWRTGWMHNRVRMIVGSFLVKDLLLPWQEGAKWFWDTLVDADLANNTLGWQWIAGCGADAAPYFRIFNPDLQAQKFDPALAYRKHWVPEAGADGYPLPLVDHATARDRALEAYSVIREGP